jgi:enoyl-CoA hydratase/carnithine racemase
MTDHIQLARDGAVLEIALSRPEKKNALTGAMYGAMIAALRDATSDSQVRVVLLHGQGSAFCAGNDLEDFLAGPEGSGPALEFIKELAGFDKPIVAAVNGLAVGIGTTMLLHCDLVYASQDARFIMPFVNLGLVPEAGASLLAPLRLGHAKAAAMLLLGEPLGATEADAAGLVTAVVSGDELLGVARNKARALAEKPNAALTASRRLMKQPMDALATRMDEEARLFADALASEDAREAFTAFLEKRPPVFNR